MRIDAQPREDPRGCGAADESSSEGGDGVHGRSPATISAAPLAVPSVPVNCRKTSSRLPRSAEARSESREPSAMTCPSWMISARSQPRRGCQRRAGGLRHPARPCGMGWHARVPRRAPAGRARCGSGRGPALLQPVRLAGALRTRRSAQDGRGGSAGAPPRRFLGVLLRAQRAGRAGAGSLAVAAVARRTPGRRGSDAGWTPRDSRGGGDDRRGRRGRVRPPGAVERPPAADRRLDALRRPHAPAAETEAAGGGSMGGPTRRRSGGPRRVRVRSRPAPPRLAVSAQHRHERRRNPRDGPRGAGRRSRDLPLPPRRRLRPGANAAPRGRLRDPLRLPLPGVRQRPQGRLDVLGRAGGLPASVRGRGPRGALGRAGGRA